MPPDTAAAVGAPRVESWDGSERRAISIRGLSKSFGRRAGGEQALQDVDLDVKAGEFLVLLGPSGCGKTTLLRTIAGLERPDVGAIEIDGSVVFDAARSIHVDAARRPVTMIFQSYALWPHMTARKNVAFPLRCAGVKRSEIPGRVTEILSLVGIGQLADRHPGEMSGGQQQRLALARALVVGARVVLFDEPLSNVDAQVREKLRLELIKMQRTLGFTAIYVTHDQSEAMELADRIAVMASGQIRQLDQPRELYSNPTDIEVARFLGQSNEIPLTVESLNDGACLVAGKGSFGKVVAVWPSESEGHPPQPGESLVAFGRPTDFVVVPSTDYHGPEENQWLGEIEAARFLGSHMEYLVRIGDDRLRCAGSLEGSDPSEGDNVTVLIGAERLRAIRER